jgi:hypothetical protein
MDARSFLGIHASSAQTVASETGGSPYAVVGPKLVDAGYSAIPVAPSQKYPGEFGSGGWKAMPGWQRFCDRLPTELEIGFWSRWPDAGVCIAIDRVLKVVDIDTDDHDLLAAVRAVLPTVRSRSAGARATRRSIEARPRSFPRRFRSRVILSQSA